MTYFAFNIGKPHIDAWWTQNVELGVVTAGFSGQPGDRGDVLLHQLEEGDWVIAYSNGHGFVGAGRVGPASSYRLLSPQELPAGWLSTHRHLRDVEWIYAVATLADGIPANAIKRQAPRQTKELLPEQAAVQLLELLAARSKRRSQPQLMDEFIQEFSAKVAESAMDTSAGRQERLRHANKIPHRVPVATYEFVRNPDVVAEVLFIANGVCGGCEKAAPFVRRSDGSPYLEVHHRMPLGAGGEDTVENAVALCPNCHRECHYGPSAA